MCKEWLMHKKNYLKQNKKIVSQYYAHYININKGLEQSLDSSSKDPNIHYGFPDFVLRGVT